MIKYSFHLGERCQFLHLLMENNLISGFNLFSGTYISFSSVIDIIKNDFKNFENNIVKFKISKLKNENDDSIEFIRCNDYLKEKLDNIKKTIINNDFNFFFSKNYYSNSNYCINLQYTDEENFKVNDTYFYKNNYYLMPNSDYSDENWLNTVNRRKNRFSECIKNNKSESILLIYMSKLVIDTDINNQVNEIIEKYTLPYNLFYVMTIYSVTEEKNPNNERIIKINNITIYTVYFPSIEFQKNNNPNYDNHLSFTDSYNKIKDALVSSYDL